ncbi:unnamed protein product [Durusdinium trenchii]|uniref:PSI subunit V n=1 Tax=Durusdinium trenchii TaxID=1381693 RepID=A0ABP0SEB4_9DINO
MARHGVLSLFGLLVLGTFAGLGFTLPRWQGAPRIRICRQAAQKDTDTFAPHSAVMFASGATLGPALDGVAHGNFGVLSYHVPPPVPIMLGAFKLFSTAIWVPPLFGFAGFLIGSLYWWIDDFLEIPEAKRCPSLLQTFAAVTLFAGNYAASGFLSSNHLGVGRSQQDLVPKDWLNNALPKSCWRALPSTE